MAIDEKRKVFPADLWGPDKQFKSNPFDRTPEEQDVKEVWFAGVHSDVGGGYPESESSLAKVPLKWMIVEAVKAGLEISKSRYKRLVLGNASKQSSRKYVAPDPNGLQHDSFKFPLKLLGTHVREIPKNAFVHETVRLRSKMKTINISQLIWI